MAGPIVHVIPYELGNPLATATTTVFSDDGTGWDYVIGGIPFLSAASSENPFIRETAPYRKDQVDQTAEPGEQSIQQWWTRSQSSFHAGAGQRYYDTPTDNETLRQIRYASSHGVNVWEPGEVSLLRQVTPVEIGGSGIEPTALIASGSVGGTDYVWLTNLKDLYRINVTSGPTYTPVQVNYDGANNATIAALAVDGENYWVATTASIWKGSLSSTGAATKLFNLPANTATVTLGWAKQRLMCAIQTSAISAVYELPSTVSAPPTTLTATTIGAHPAPQFIHPNKQFQFTCFADAPGAILLGGYSGSSSAVYKMILDQSGDAPQLSIGITAAELPAGERLFAMAAYLGTYLGMVTSEGVRIAVFDPSSAGDFVYGALTVETPATNGGITAVGNYFAATYTHEDGTAGLARISLGQEIKSDSGIFGWAPDLRAATAAEVDLDGAAGQVVALRGGRLAFTVPGEFLFIEHPSKLVPTGSLTTSKIRFGTLDPKVFRFTRVWGTGFGGSVGVSVSIDGGTGQSIGTIALPTQTDSGDLAVSVPVSREAALTLTLSRDLANTAVGPTMRAYQLKALPAQRRQRLVQVPCLCFDKTMDQSGHTVFQDGFARDRLHAVEELESRGDICLFQILNPQQETTWSEYCVVEQTTFTQNTNPTDRGAIGGILLVRLRTVN